MAYARLTAFPPLNRVTVIPAEQTQVLFVARVQWSHVRPKYPIEVALCYAAIDASEHQSKWPATMLGEADNPWTMQQKDVHVACFSTSLSPAFFGSNSCIQVTYKYRVGSTAPWIWVDTQQSVSPSRIVLQKPVTDVTQKLSHFIDLSSGWNATELSRSDGALMSFRLETTVSLPHATNHEEENELTEHVLGKIRNQVQHMALVRLEPYWLGPRHGRDYFYLSEDAVLCSFLGATGQVVTVLTTSGNDDVYSVIRSDGDGDLVIAARCDSDEDVPFRCFVAVANTMQQSISAVVVAAREMVNDRPQYQQLSIDSSLAETSRASIESWYDGLTFCTWNALGQDLSESKILDALSSLTKHDIRISSLLIDDNWQVLGPIPGHDYSDSFNRGLCSLTANSSVAPEGLQSLTLKIRSLHPYVTDIGVWHALLGYWGGISPTGEVANNYDTVEVLSYLMGNVPANITSVAPKDLRRFYADLYKYLSDSGITFVKTDVQHMLSMFRSSQSRRTLVPAYQSAWTTSRTQYFSGKGISCMSQVPEILFSSLLQSHGPRVLARNSDDFYPEVAASHPWHIWTNAHNALLTQHLNVLPDWDMFQTDHPYSYYHAAARCISGGPITITDTPGLHDTTLLKQATALDPRGRSIALRPDVATVVGGFEEYITAGVLEIGTTTAAGYSLLGLWNIADTSACTLIPLSDFPQIRDTGDKVVVCDYRTKQIFGPFDTTVVSRPEGISTTDLIFSEMETRGWEIWTACPLRTLQVRARSVSIAILGLIDKMTGAAAMISVPRFSAPDSDSVEVELSLKAVGVLGLCLFTPSDVTPSLEMELLGQNYETVDTEHIEREKMTINNPGTTDQAWRFTFDLENEWRRKDLFSQGHETAMIKLRFSIID